MCPQSITSSPPRYAPWPDRFWAKVDTSGEHWLWTGCRNSQGYGFIHPPGWRRPIGAHRVAWELASGAPVPDGYIIGHTCDTPGCVRNDDPGVYHVDGIALPRFGHLFLCTYAQNAHDCIAKGRWVRASVPPTHCYQGHPLSGANLYTNPYTGKRQCRTCRDRITHATWYRRMARQKGVIDMTAPMPQHEGCRYLTLRGHRCRRNGYFRMLSPRGEVRWFCSQHQEHLGPDWQWVPLPPQGEE